MQNIHGKFQKSPQQGLKVRGFCRTPEKKCRMPVETSPKSTGKGAGCPQGIPSIRGEKCRISMGNSKHPWEIPSIHAESARYQRAPSEIHVERADIHRKFQQIHQKSAGWPPSAPRSPRAEPTSTNPTQDALITLSPPFFPPQKMNCGPFSTPAIPV